MTRRRSLLILTAAVAVPVLAPVLILFLSGDPGEPGDMPDADAPGPAVSLGPGLLIVDTAAVVGQRSAVGDRDPLVRLLDLSALPAGYDRTTPPRWTPGPDGRVRTVVVGLRDAAAERPGGRAPVTVCLTTREAPEGLGGCAEVAAADAVVATAEDPSGRLLAVVALTGEDARATPRVRRDWRRLGLGATPPVTAAG